MNAKRKIKNYCHFDRLQEVWLGGCYPEHFFSHLDNKHQDIFCQISEKTNASLNKIQKVFENLDVLVQRPQFNSLEDFLDDSDRLIKPPITPCDFALSIDDHLYVIPQYPSGVDPFQHAIDQYQDNCVTILDRSIPDPECYLVFSSFVKIGQDVYIDYNKDDPDYKKYNEIVIKNLSKKYRVHVSTTGEHSDSVFCPVNSNTLLSSHYRTNYSQSFPGWQVHYYKDTSNDNIKTFDTEQKWYVPGIDYMFYNEEIIDIAHHWLGMPTETVFEINMCVIDQNNIICFAPSDNTLRFLEEINVTAHVVDFDTKYFWDAGLHCLTRDIIRSGSNRDYWPNRGKPGVYKITEWD